MANKIEIDPGVAVELLDLLTEDERMALGRRAAADSRFPDSVLAWLFNRLNIPEGPRGSEGGSASSQRKRVHTKDANGDFEKAVVAVLKANGNQPMRSKDLVAELKKRGVSLPGKGTQANVTVRLGRMEQVTRPKYGHYALKALKQNAKGKK